MASREPKGKSIGVIVAINIIDGDTTGKAPESVQAIASHPVLPGWRQGERMQRFAAIKSQTHPRELEMGTEPFRNTCSMWPPELAAWLALGRSPQ